MPIMAFGLHWEADEVEWFPGRGRANAFRLLGRRNENNPALRVADFRHQSGLYVLYDNYGPHYVGLTEKQDLGTRLKQHRSDGLAETWHRFSWFGFRGVEDDWIDEAGVQWLMPIEKSSSVQTPVAIRDTEALLMRALGTYSNQNITAFAQAHEWTQIPLHDYQKYLNKIKPRG